MPVQVEQLGRAFTAENEYQFTVWTLATPDPLERVLGAGYFANCRSRFRLGDLLVCATSQPPPRTAPPTEIESQRRSLLMVTRLEPRAVEVRLVQDWGAPRQVPAAERAQAQERRRRQRLASFAWMGRMRLPARGIRRARCQP